MVTPMIPLASCLCPQSLPLIWTACRRWCRLVCVWCRLPPVCRLAQRRPSQESSLSCPWQLCGGRPATAQPCPTFGPWSSPATRRDNQTAYILHILSTDATTLCILYIYICSQGLGRWWAGVQEALSRPAQVSVDVSSGGGPRVAQEAHTGTQVQAVSWSWHSVSRQPRHQTVAHSNTVTLLHPALRLQVQLDTRPLHPPPLPIWCDDGGPWDVWHWDTEQYICIQILDISSVSAGWQRLC